MVIRTAILGIEGMTCASCSGTVESAIRDVHGVLGNDPHNPVSVTLTTNSATFTYDADVATMKQIIAAVEEIGFDAEIVKDEPLQNKRKKNSKKKKGGLAAGGRSSNPQTVERQVVLAIEGMSCTSCSGTVESAICSLPGVRTDDPDAPVTVTVSTNTARFVYNPALLSVRRVIDEISSVGFGAELLRDDPLHRKAATAAAAAAAGGSSISGCTAKDIDSGAESDGLPNSSAGRNGRSPSNEGYADGGDDLVGSEENTLLVFEAFTASAAYSNACNAWQAYEAHLKAMPGVQFAEAYYDDSTGSATGGRAPDRMSVSFDDGVVGPRDFAALAVQLGLKCNVTSLGGFMMANRLLKQQAKEARETSHRFMLSCALTVPIFCITMVLPMLLPAVEAPLGRPVLQGSGLTWRGLILLLLATPVQVYVGKPFHAKALKTLKTRRLGMDFLVSTGTTAAYVYSLCGLVLGILRGQPDDHNLEYFETSAVLITAVLLGKYLEVYARSQTANAIHKLSNMKASTARLVKSGTAAAALPAAAATGPSHVSSAGYSPLSTVADAPAGDLEMQSLGRGKLRPNWSRNYTNCNLQYIELNNVCFVLFFMLLYRS